MGRQSSGLPHRLTQKLPALVGGSSHQHQRTPTDMGEVINVSFAQSQTDGGKSRLLRAHPNFRARNLAEPICDLSMGRADPEDTGMPSDSAYSAPDQDVA
jgi:hypothetical protein